MMDIDGSAKTAASTAYQSYNRKRGLSRLYRLLYKFVILTILVKTLTIYIYMLEGLVSCKWPRSTPGPELRLMSSSGYRVVLQVACLLMFVYRY